MSQALDNLSKQNLTNLAIGAAVVIGVVYLILRQTAKDVVAAGGAVATAAGGVLTGDNVITSGSTQHDFSGQSTTAYEGKGVFGTLGAGTNSVLGGAPASIGEIIGQWTFDIFGPKVDINGK